MKNIWLCATLLGFWAAQGLTQTTEELVNDGKNTENVTTLQCQAAGAHLEHEPHERPG
jgi:hypothetical protein